MSMRSERHKQESNSMAPLVFSAKVAQETKKFNFTFGRSREDSRWVDRRQLSFAELTGILSAASVGAKNGECFVPSLFSKDLRRMDHATQIDVAVLDSDCGHSFEDIHEKVAAKGWRAIIHSTHSHLTNQTIIAAAPADKWLKENPGKKIGQYMIVKKGFLPNIMGIAKIEDEISVGEDSKAKNFIISHAPCPKFRIILPLHKSWIAEEYETQELANAKWRERIGALSYALNLNTDQSCVDPSRLFYLPRVRDDAAREIYVYEALQGEDCDLWSLPDAQASTQASAVASSSLFDFHAAGGTVRRSGEVVSLTPRGVAVPSLAPKKTFVTDDGEIFDLNLWAANYAHKFEIFNAISKRSPEMISVRRSGVKHHIYCPRSGEHITGGVEGSGTYVVNASGLAAANLPSISSGFVIHCMHSGCAGADRLDHIKAMLENKNLLIEDLTNEEFLQGDSPNINISKIIENLENKKNNNQQEENKNLKVIKLNQTQSQRERDTGNIAPYLYKDLPGALGAIHRFMCEGAMKPQPALALGGALALCASAIGQRVKMQHFGTRPNIYILAVGVSGSGKERPISATKQIARAAGLYKELVGVEEVASDTGIVTSVATSPRQLMLIDEASFLLNAMSDPRAGQHMKNVIGTLLKLYSSSHTTYASKSYADAERVKLIDQPSVSFFGTSTPEGLTDSLTAKDINSGLLSRMLVFDAGEHDPRMCLPATDPPPPEVLQWLTAWNAVLPVPNPMARIGGDAVISPRVVMMTEEAKDIAMTFEGEMHEAKQKARKRGKDALYVRAFENALKFALIRACASVWPVMNEAGDGIMIDESRLKVDAQTMRWAIELSQTCVERMDVTTDEIANTGYEQNLKAIKQLTRKAGTSGITMRTLLRNPAGKMPAKSLNELLASLDSAEEIKMITLPPKGRGRPKQVFIHKDYFKNYDITGLVDDEDGDEEEEKTA